MVWIIGGFIFWVAVAVLAYAAANWTNEHDEKIGKPSYGLGVLGGAFFLWVIITAGVSIRVVDAGNVGVVRSFGSITSQRSEGLQLIFPWQSLESWNIREHSFTPPEDSICFDQAKHCLETFSKDNQDVAIRPVVNIKINVGAVQGLARSVGSGYERTVVQPAVYQILKNVVGQYPAAELSPNGNRTKVANEVQATLQQQLKPYSIDVISVSLQNIEFRPDFKQAIENKVIAEQNAIAEQNKVEVSRAQANQRVEEAKGRANALVEEARGQAEANRQVTASLTPALIQWQAVQKLGDNIQIALIPSGQGIILDPATLLAPQR